MSIDTSDLEPKYDTFSYKGENYWLHEAPAGAASRYNNLRRKVIKVQDDQIAGFNDGSGDLEIVLVSGCVYKDLEMKQPVSMDTVRAWPHKLVNRLYKRALELCPELTPKGTVDPKAEQTPTSGTSG